MKTGIKAIGEKVAIHYGAGLPSVYGVVTGFRVERNEVLGSEYNRYTITLLDGTTEVVGFINPSEVSGVGVRFANEQDLFWFDTVAENLCTGYAG